MPDLKFDPEDKLHNLLIAEFEIEHEDTFHLKNLYKLIHEWFHMNKFVSVDNGDDKIESLYFHKVLGNGNVEHHMWWRAHNIPQGNKYYKYFLKLDFQTLNMGKDKVKKDGRDYSTNKGDLILRCKAWVILDYKHEWRNHPILKYFDKWYIKRIYKSQVDFLKGDLWVKTYKLQDVIKQYMKLKTPTKMPKPFHDELGI
ncbi:hypothetical protein K9L67_05455 [Candidatus Woesearchaeota archaeon]|nr:hypothetical protein [Candidatus Woesearchaeota archaeon]MCF7901645.1 hypothetical protein [Candidatus Woesearchaeota archaeon]MCF8013263.1 hypothetical protein [Candidatus Woesearchaeota archaeon]